jgi:DNA repair exonuclease SbcCD nuclease subunit
MKYLVTADWHAGVPQKLSYTIWAANVILRYAIQNDIEHVFILGDLFHDRVNLNVEVFDAVYKFFNQDEAKGVQFYAFPGNHDMFLKNSWDIVSIKPLEKLIHVMTDVKKLKIDGETFWILPFVHREEEYMSELGKLEKQCKDGDVLLTHIGVNGAKLNECFLLKNWSFVTFGKSKFDVVFAGHFHCHQSVGKNVTYPGSPVAFRFDEGLVPHGFIIYDSDDRSVQFIDIRNACPSVMESQSPPLYLTAIDSDVMGKPAEFFKGNLVRLVLTQDYTKDELAKLESSVRERGAIGVSWVKPKEADVEIDAARKSEIDMQAPARLLEQWVEKDKPEGIDRRLLAKLNEQIIQEAEERISVSLAEE